MATKLKFIFERSTKGAHRYQECDSKTHEVRDQQNPDCVVGTLYLRKLGFGETAPPYVEVTIESLDK